MYIGVTSDLARRVAEHKGHLVGGFTARYKCEDLVYFEAGRDIAGAILREKQLKKWNWAWKERLVTGQNPGWDDLAAGIGVTPVVVSALREAYRAVPEARAAAV